MKNFIILILVIVSLIAGYFAVYGRWKLSLEGLEGKTATLVRGDLSIPIDATGEVKPSRRVEIKAEASGEVIEIHKRAGERVSAGDLLIRLQPDEEERSEQRAKLDLEVARARLAIAETVLQQARIPDIIAAEQQIKQLEASLELVRFQKTKFESLPAHEKNKEEEIQKDTNVRRAEAQLESARAELERAKLAVVRAEQELKQATATFATAENNLADARKRLAKTDIVAPINGIVGDIRVQIGEVIQGGKTTLGGGSLLAFVLDLDRLIVKTEVDESDIGRVLIIAPEWARPGNAGASIMPSDLEEAAASMQHLPTIKVETFRDLEFRGIIDRIYPESNKISGVGTYIVDVLILGEDRQSLLPGMRADVRFTSEHVSNVVLCPNDAIREGPNGKLGVYIPRPGAPAAERETEFIGCKFGLDNGNYSEVQCTELTVGMTVYTKLPTSREEMDRSRKSRRAS